MKEELQKAGIVPVIKLKELDKAVRLQRRCAPAGFTVRKLRFGQKVRKRSYAR